MQLCKVTDQVEMDENNQNAANTTEFDRNQANNDNLGNLPTEADPVPVKKSRKDEWKRNKNSRLRMEGKTYTGFSPSGEQNECRRARKMKQACNSPCCTKSATRHCNEISEEERQKCFDKYWKELNWEQKKLFVSNLIDVDEKKHHTTQGESRRTQTFEYYLEINNKRVRVCRIMFLNTLDISGWQANNWKLNALQRNTRKAKVRQEKHKSSGRKLASEFLDSLPKLPSHYCRQSSKKQYLYDEIPNQVKLYQVFVEFCGNKGQDAPGRNVLARERKAKNIDFDQPKKDRCDTCVSNETGNCDADKFTEHIAKKTSARNAKNEDKVDQDTSHSVWTMDVQAVLISPRLNASALYYKTKLASHNFTMYNLKTKEVKCFVWDETQADLSSSVFATCIRKVLLQVIESDPGIKTITLWSDGCGYQNRNQLLSNMLLDFAIVHQVTIQQKFLEKGHTQMEADSIHATIERKLKHRTIYWPNDYVSVMKECRPSQPYDVAEMKFEDFLDFSKIGYLQSIRPGKKVGDALVHQLRALRYTEDGKVEFKLNHDDAYKPLPQRVKMAVDPYEIKPLFPSRLKVKKMKFDHMQQLKFVMPSIYHEFYDNLPH